MKRVRIQVVQTGKPAWKNFQMSKKSRSSSRVAIGQVVARRELTDVRGPKRRVVVSVGLPRQVSTDEWQCTASVDGLEARPILKNTHGVDSLQALMLAVELLRKWLKESHCDLVWPDDGTPCPAGDIPHQVPMYFGEEFVDQVEQLTKREGPRFMDNHFKMLRAHVPRATRADATSNERASSKRRRRSE